MPNIIIYETKEVMEVRFLRNNKNYGNNRVGQRQKRYHKKLYKAPSEWTLNHKWVEEIGIMVQYCHNGDIKRNETHHSDSESSAGKSSY